MAICENYCQTYGHVWKCFLNGVIATWFVLVTLQMQTVSLEDTDYHKGT